MSPKASPGPAVLGRLPSIQRNFLLLSLGLLVLSALVWLFSRYAIEGHEGWGGLALESQFWAIKLHGLGMLAFLLALGSCWESIRQAIRKGGRKLRRAVIVTLTVVGTVVLSGWLILYGPSGEANDWISIAHWCLGILACAALAFIVIRD